MKNETNEDIVREAIDVIKEINAVDTSRGYERIAHSIRMKKRNRRLKFYARIGAAACVVAAVTATLWYSGPVDEAASKAESEILPGEKQARLILADGREIAIGNSFMEGQTIDEGNTVITSEEGVLRYQRKIDGQSTVLPVNVNHLYIPKGGEFDVILDDGTRVWLNSDSHMSYPSAFMGNERRVYLEGEAYFEVAEDVDKPFVVETAEQTLTVLGTKFNVYAYADESKIITTLVEGSVSLVGRQSDSEYLLSPGQQAELTPNGNYIIRKVDVAEEIAWKNGFFVFDDLSLEQVMTKLARWYNVDVRYLNEEARHIEFKGNLPRYENLRSLLDIFEKSSPARFTIHNNTITITL